MTRPTQENIVALSPPEMEALCQELGWQFYRSRQILKWLWQKGANDFETMSDISHAGRQLLAARFRIGRLAMQTMRRSADGTVKFLLKLEDDTSIESVFIPEENRRTVCVSTQVGCPLRCRFCRTGQTRFVRNLAWHEIVDQVVTISKLTGQRPTNVVFMGMGEPFLNYNQVVVALSMLNADYGLKMGARHLTVSTAGIPERIRAYAHLPLQARLAVSLNAADEQTRSQLMPVNRRYPLTKVIEAVKEFIDVTHRRVTFEYVLIAGINDRPEDARSLVNLLSGLPCKINLIPLNPFPGLTLKSPSASRVRQFAESLYQNLPTVTIRRSRGASIQAGCGQLAVATPR